MSGAATQVYSREFDQALAKLPKSLGSQIVEKISEMGARLEGFPHYRMTGRSEYRLRVGDYRVIYDFDVARNVVYLITLGHRREVYR